LFEGVSFLLVMEIVRSVYWGIIVRRSVVSFGDGDRKECEI
jgi:hypothetical protein